MGHRGAARSGIGLVAMTVCLAAACTPPPNESPGMDYEPPSLSPAERAAGWRLLFDGRTSSGWRNFRGEGIDPRWHIEDGALTLTAAGGGDLITVEQFENFELALEWRISEGGNSGILFNVVEDDHDEIWRTGPEFQVLDDARHPDRHDPTHRAGANYDLHAPRVAAARPVGEYNAMRLIVDRGHVQHWLNGELVVEYDLWTPEWEALVADSKFATMPAYGRARSGHIALQDHGDRVWYRNIRIRPL